MNMEYHVITKEQHDFVIQSIPKKVGWKAIPKGSGYIFEYYFFGTHDEWLDFLRRAEALTW